MAKKPKLTKNNPKNFPWGKPNPMSPTGKLAKSGGSPIVTSLTTNDGLSKNLGGVGGGKDVTGKGPDIFKGVFDTLTPNAADAASLAAQKAYDAASMSLRKKF